MNPQQPSSPQHPQPQQEEGLSIDFDSDEPIDAVACNLGDDEECEACQ